jgi:hypothetical protein
MSLILSCRLTISLSVELLVLIFCLFEELIMALRPNVRGAPVWPLQLLCVWCDALTYLWMRERDYAKRISLRLRVELRYLRTRFSLSQSSSLSCLTHVVRNTTVIWISRQTWERKSDCAVVWWKACACSSRRQQAYTAGCIEKRWSAAGVEDTPVILSGKALGSHVEFNRAFVG